jgi:hypothetical protein
VDLFVTNVPGPQLPLFLLGARLLEVFPVVQVAGNVPLSVAVLSYDGQLNIGIQSDPDGCRTWTSSPPACAGRWTNWPRPRHRPSHADQAAHLGHKPSTVTACRSSAPTHWSREPYEYLVALDRRLVHV